MTPCLRASETHVNGGPLLVFTGLCSFLKRVLRVGSLSGLDPLPHAAFLAHSLSGGTWAQLRNWVIVITDSKSK